MRVFIIHRLQKRSLVPQLTFDKQMLWEPSKRTGEELMRRFPQLSTDAN